MGASRKALQDITQGASNGRSAKRRKLAKDRVVLDGEEDLGFRDIEVSPKKHGTSKEQQMPSAREHVETSVPDKPLIERRSQPLIEQSEESEEEDEAIVVPRQVIRSKYRGQLGAVLRRQLDEPWQPGRRGRVRITAGQYL